MDGVMILSSETIYNNILPEWFGGWSALGFILFTLICFMTLTEGCYRLGTLCAVLAVVFIVTGYCSDTPNKNSVDHIEYRVLIDESVSMTEFFDKYEVIDKDGRIYTIKER